jgi:hypothetical protein
MINYDHTNWAELWKSRESALFHGDILLQILFKSIADTGLMAKNVTL